MGVFGGSGGGAPSRWRSMAGGLGAKPTAAKGWGFGARPPALKNFEIFSKNNFILGLFGLKNNAFKTWLRNWQCKQN